jgi:hypothetical protein
MDTAPIETSSADREHLRLLSVFHYVMAAMAGVFALFPIIHLLIGIGILSGKLGQHGNEDPSARMVGGFFVVIALLLIVGGLAYAACLAYAGRCLAQRQGYTFCLVMAGVSCLLVPFGTALGVFTIIVLMRSSVAAEFGKRVTAG